jgi:hypothetical protein
MPIDDPIDAAEKQINNDELQLPSNAVMAILKGIGGVSSLAHPLTDQITKLIESRRQENRVYYVRVLADELRALGARVAKLDEAHARFIANELPGLISEGARRATDVRADSRIRRIAAIVVHAAEVGPAKAVEVADEMMRIAAELTDHEVKLLLEMYKVQKQSGPRPNVNDNVNSWRHLEQTNPLFTGPDTYSICAKLQSFGLIITMGRSDNLGLESITYGILPRGKEFIDYIHRADTASRAATK